MSLKIDTRCIATDCANLWFMCQNNTNCKPIYKAFNDSCYEVYTPLTNPIWEYNFCPTNCAENLANYVDYVAPGYTSLRFCDCNGDTDCELTKVCDLIICSKISFINMFI